MTPDEQTAIADGLGSPFWALFKQYVEAEWGQGGVRFDEAVERAASKDAENGHQYLQMVLFARKEIIKLLSWPEEVGRSAAAKAELQARPGSRRGPGL
jgi:hypothetical protein